MKYKIGDEIIITNVHPNNNRLIVGKVYKVVSFHHGKEDTPIVNAEDNGPGVMYPDTDNTYELYRGYLWKREMNEVINS